MKTNNQKEIKKIVLKYLNGTCSGQELERLHQWIMDKENEQRLNELVDELLQDQDLPYTAPEENEEARIWNGIYSKLKPTVYPKRPSADQVKVNYRIRRIFQPMGIAATVALLISTGIAIWFFARSGDKVTYPPDTLISWSEKKTNAGEKIAISLPDGSKVKLNSSSILRYSTDFNVANRILSLDGEAFFEVARNEQKPFIVVTGNIETSVLGTSFNVKSLSDSAATIAVTSGNVLVKDRAGNHTIELRKDEMTNVHLKNPVWHKTDFDYAKVIGWKDGTLVFENEGFDKILVRLESWYGVEFEVLGHANPDILINTTYKNDPLDRILEGLSFTYGFSFEIKEKRVIIRFKS